jgi:molybdopterin molybdotransferase
MSEGLLSYVEAAQMVAQYAGSLAAQRRGTERVDLAQAAGRVLAREVIADQDQPPFARSTRDGFACRAAEAMGHGWVPVGGATHAGEAPPGPLPAGAFWEIMTGAPVPADADAVVMVEHVEREGDRVRLEADRSIKAGENVVVRGAQAREGMVLVPAGAVMGTAQIAVAATCGYAAVDVYARPKVAILTTGDELVEVDAEPGPGQIRNSNAPMLAALVAAAGGEPWVLPTAADTAEALDSALTAAMHAGLLLISGGVSAGKFDLVEPALARLGAEFFFTGVRIQPGKPLVFGALHVADDRVLPFFGLPGNPISSAATFRLFGAQVLAALSGSTELAPQFMAAQLAKDVKEKPGLTRFLPAHCKYAHASGGFPQVATVPWHGSGDLPAFARANCFLVVPEDASNMEAGAMVRILML